MSAPDSSIHENTKRRPTHADGARRPRWSESAVLVLGLLITVMLFMLADRWEAQRQAADRQYRVALYARAIEETLERQIADIQALARFYGAADAVSADQFARFTRPSLGHHPGLEALEWIPRVPAAERAAFEARARAEGSTDFVIHDRDGETLNPAGPRPEYFPALRIAPPANHGSLGLDQGADPERRAAMEQARDTGLPTAGAPLILARAPDRHYSLLVFVPQTAEDGAGDGAGDSLAARRERLRGFALGVVDLNDLLATVLDRLPPHRFDLALRDGQVPGAASPLAVHPAHTRGPGTAFDLDAFDRDPLAQEAPLAATGRTLVLRGAPVPGTAPGNRPALVLLGLGAGTSLLLALLLRVSREAAARQAQYTRHLREGEERLRLALDAGRMGIFDWEIPADRLTWSRQHEVLFGLAPGEFDGTYASIRNRIHPDDRPRMEAEVQRGLAGDAPCQGEYRVVWPDGSEHWLAWRGEFARDAEGRALRMRGSVTEVTDRHAAEAQIGAGRAILEAALSSMTDAVFITDAQGHFVHFNDAFAAFHRFANRDDCARTLAAYPAILEVTMADGSPVAREQWAVSRALRGETVARAEYRLCRKDTGESWFGSYSFAPIRDQDGQTVGSVVTARDITALKAAENARRADHARLEAWFAAIPDAIIEYDARLRPVRANSAAMRVLGRTDKDFTRDDAVTALDFRPLDDDALILDELPTSRALRGEAVTGVPYRIRTPEGEERIISTYAVPLYQDGRIEGVLSLWHDITDLQRAQLDLRRYQQIVETSSEMLIFLDRDLRYQVVNPAFAGYYQTTVEALKGTRVADLLPPERYAKVAPHLAASLAGEPRRVLVEGPDPAGRFRSIEAEMQPFLEHGEVQGIVVNLHDLTEVRQTQAALEQERALLEERVAARTAELQALAERLQLATEAGGIGVWEWDMLTNQVRWDDRARGLYGLAPSADGESFADWLGLVHPQDRPLVERILEDILAGRAGAFRVTLRMNHPAGDTRYLVSCGKVIRDPAGSARHLIGVNWDITDLKGAQERAEEAARAKAEFLAHMSHEIRTPLNGIIGLTELALHLPLEPAVRDYLEKVNQSGQGLLGIINDILDQSRIEAGRLTLDLAPFDLEQLLAALRALFDHAAGARGLELEITADPDVPRYLRGDVTRLQQVLFNLLGNALKFTERGRVELHVTCTARAEARAHLRWTVTDTGIGMDTETCERLFQPFTQGDGSIARRFGGSGLGLAISRSLARLMGGELSAASTPGAGSTFTLDLPIEVASAPGPAPIPAPPATVLAGARVLVAEDHAINRQVIGDMLRLLGLQVTLAGDGEEALRHLAEAPFDAVLMDVQMPGMDGLTATRRIRENPAWAGLPVIALTAGVTEDERARIGASGMSDLLPKPSTLNSIAATLARWIAAPGTTPGATPAAGPAHPAVTPLLPPPDAGPDAGGGLGPMPGFDLGTLLLITADAAGAAATLRQFAEDVRTDPYAIATALAAGDGTQAAQRVHRLKGAAGTIGATDLHRAAAALEERLAAGADPATALHALRAAHEAALAHIAALPPAPASPRSAPAERSAALPGLAAEVQALLTQGSLVPPALLARLGAALSSDDQDLYDALKRHLDRFDYPAAARLLRPLLEPLLEPLREPLRQPPREPPREPCPPAPTEGT